MAHPKVGVPSMKAYMRQRRHDETNPPGINAKAHAQLHGPLKFIYTGVKPMIVETGSPIHLPRGGTITRVTGNVNTTGTGDVTFDLLLDGYPVADSAFRISAGDVQSKFKIVQRPNFDETTKFRIDITNVSDAAGPLVVVIEYLPEF